MTYTNNTQSVSIHWGGFLDPHSGVISYRLALGTQPHGADVMHWRHVAVNSYGNKTLK